MFATIIRVAIQTAVREITRQGIMKAFHTPKAKESRKSYYKGKR
jgi:hypothetical protein